MVSHGCFAGMAPKKTTTTGKFRKGEATSSLTLRNQPYDKERFKSRYHHNRYIELLQQSMWLERVFQIKPEGRCQDIAKLLNDQGWARLFQPDTNLNVDLVREFYANALPENPHTDPFTFETYVRGRTIWFDREAINKYLGNPFPLEDEDDMDDFHDKQVRAPLVFLPNMKRL